MSQPSLRMGETSPRGAAVRVLIDGYNFMHAVGMAPPARSPRAAHDAARRRFLDWLAGTPGAKAEPTSLRVVFDAQNSTRDLGTSTHRGLPITFSFRQTADDLIEALINVCPHPARLKVVSNDGRLKDFARRKRCEYSTCEAFLDWLLTPPTADPLAPPPPDDKPKDDWPDEMDTLLRAFG